LRLPVAYPSLILLQKLAKTFGDWERVLEKPDIAYGHAPPFCSWLMVEFSLNLKL
jgi:hypothetical protein